MTPSKGLTRIVDGKKYSVESSQYICGDDYWDGSNWERGGRNRHLYRTAKGAFFFAVCSQWAGEPCESVVPCSEAEAAEFAEEYCSASEYEEHFGPVEEA